MFKMAFRMSNSAVPDQTASWEQSDQGLHSLLRHLQPKTKDHYSVIKLINLCFL